MNMLHFSDFSLLFRYGIELIALYFLYDLIFLVDCLYISCRVDDVSSCQCGHESRYMADFIAVWLS